MGFGCGQRENTLSGFWANWMGVLQAMHTGRSSHQVGRTTWQVLLAHASRLCTDWAVACKQYFQNFSLQNWRLAVDWGLNILRMSAAEIFFQWSKGFSETESKIVLRFKAEAVTSHGSQALLRLVSETQEIEMLSRVTTLESFRV